MQNLLLNIRILPLSKIYFLNISFLLNRINNNNTNIINKMVKINCKKSKPIIKIPINQTLTKSFANPKIR